MRLTNKKPNTPPALAELEAKRAELDARLAALVEDAARLDPVADWERAGSLAAQQTALQNALTALDAQLVTARQQAADEARTAADEAAAQRKSDAIVGARTTARAAVDVLGHFDATVLADLDAAVREVRACGGYPPPEVAQIVNLRQQVTRTLEALRRERPEWFGLPEPMSAQERAVYEAREHLERAERRLDALLKAPNRGQMWHSRVEEAKESVQDCQNRVSAMTGETFVAAKLTAAVARAARYFDSVPAAEVVT